MTQTVPGLATVPQAVPSVAPVLQPVLGVQVLRGDCHVATAKKVSVGRRRKPLQFFQIGPQDAVVSANPLPPVVPQPAQQGGGSVPGYMTVNCAPVPPVVIPSILIAPTAPIPLAAPQVTLTPHASQILEGAHTTGHRAALLRICHSFQQHLLHPTVAPLWPTVSSAQATLQAEVQATLSLRSTLEQWALRHRCTNMGQQLGLVTVQWLDALHLSQAWAPGTTIAVAENVSRVLPPLLPPGHWGWAGWVKRYSRGLVRAPVQLPTQAKTQVSAVFTLQPAHLFHLTPQQQVYAALSYHGGFRGTDTTKVQGIHLDKVHRQLRVQFHHTKTTTQRVTVIVLAQVWVQFWASMIREHTVATLVQWLASTTPYQRSQVAHQIGNCGVRGWRQNRAEQALAVRGRDTDVQRALQHKEVITSQRYIALK